MKPPASVTRGLGAAGRAFVRGAYQNYEFDALEAAAVRVAAQSLDDVEEARKADDTKAAHRAQRQFLAALQRLGLPRHE